MERVAATKSGFEQIRGNRVITKSTRPTPKMVPAHAAILPSRKMGIVSRKMGIVEVEKDTCKPQVRSKIRHQIERIKKI